MTLDDLEVAARRDASSSAISEGGGSGKDSALDQVWQRRGEIGLAVVLEATAVAEQWQQRLPISQSKTLVK